MRSVWEKKQNKKKTTGQEKFPCGLEKHSKEEQTTILSQYFNCDHLQIVHDSSVLMSFSKDKLFFFGQ